MKNPPPSKPPVTQSLKLKQIEIADLQARVATDDKTIAEYAEAFTDGAKFPPVIVFHDGKNYFLADGFHRYFGVKKAGLVDILADVRSGTRKDALWFAAGANKTHGLKRSNEDKRHAVELALKEKPELADNAIATHVGVSFHLVKQVRYQVRVREPEAVKTETRTGLDGKKYPAPPTSQVRVREPEAKPAAKPFNVIPLPIKPSPPEKTVTIPIKPTPIPPPQKSKEPESVLDKTGHPIPPVLLPMWNRAHEVSEILDALSTARSTLKKAQEGKDKLYARLNYSSVLSELDSAYTSIKAELPFAVCPTCQGKSADSCALCKGKAFVGKFIWDTAVTKEAKAIREKAKVKK